MKIRAEKISKEYMRNGHGSNTFFAVQETDFMLNEGTLTVLTGRSGSGKSTLLNMLCGLSAPTSGKVMLDETDLYARREDGCGTICVTVVCDVWIVNQLYCIATSDTDVLSKAQVWL